MLQCIACSKQVSKTGSLRAGDNENDAATLSTKQAIKTLTSQIKDMAVKASGAYKHCKPCSRTRTNLDGDDADSVSEMFYGSYRRTGRSNSSSSPRVKAISSGSATPTSISGRTESVVFMEEDETKEWTAQVEPGVLITFVSLPQTQTHNQNQGGNDLKRIRFSREIFNKWQAQRWWEENSDKVMELYNVKRFNQHAVPLPTPPRSEDENSRLESAEDSPVTPPLSKERLPRHFCRPISSESVEDHPVQAHKCYDDSVGHNSTPKLSNISAAKTETSSVDASARSSCSRDLSVSNASDIETEWVEQDEPGVYITVRALPTGGRELRRVRFSRDRFGEMNARLWWEENKGRIQQQYL